jgi:hypothetical protein
MCVGQRPVGRAYEKLSLNYGIEMHSVYLSLSFASFFYSKSSDCVPHAGNHTGKTAGVTISIRFQSRSAGLWVDLGFPICEISGCKIPASGKRFGV